MASGKIKTVECISMEKRGNYPQRHYVYVLRVEWSNGEKHPIYRKYSAFFDLEKTLRERLDCTYSKQIPELPHMNVLEKAFHIAKNHISDINDFCQALLKLPQEISSCHTIHAFFEVWNTDFQMDSQTEDTESNRNHRTKKLGERRRPLGVIKADTADKLTNGCRPITEHATKRKMSVDDDEMVLHEAIVDYLADAEGELSLARGAKVFVLERNNDGWWFVLRDSGDEQGYAPGAYLRPVQTDSRISEIHLYSSIDDANESLDSNANSKTDMKVRALSDYDASGVDEISYKQGEELDVLATNDDGWWTVRCRDKVGLVPAVHLELDARSAREGSVLWRNNSLYHKKPPPRNFLTQEQEKVSHRIEPAYITLVGEKESTSVNKMPPKSQKVPASKKTETSPELNYAEIVFDEGPTKRPVLTTNKTKSSGVVYTEIVPKNLRSKSSDSLTNTSATEKVEDKSAARHGKPQSPKFRQAPNSPLNQTKTTSPVMTKKIPAPLPAYENHEIVSQQAEQRTTPPSTPVKHTYINVKLPKEPSSSLSSSPPEDLFRRSSIEPPPPPSTASPKPKKFTHHRSNSSDRLINNISRIQASESYDGKAISGMLMFAKGDLATLLCESGNTGWWYVNLKGLEGYVPSAFWEPYTEESTSSLTNNNMSSLSPVSRRKAPQPMPRARSPVPIAATLDRQAWFHGRMSRPGSENILMKHGNGVFLIRESVNRVGDLTLSVKWEDKVRHFPIEAKEGGLFYIGKHDFKDLDGVVNHYSNHALFFSEKNTAVKLITPAPKLRKGSA